MQHHFLNYDRKQKCCKCQKLLLDFFLDVCNYQLGSSEDLLAPGSNAVPWTCYKCCVKEVKKPWQPSKMMASHIRRLVRWIMLSTLYQPGALFTISRHFHFHLSFSFWQHIKKTNTNFLWGKVLEQKFIVSIKPFHHSGLQTCWLYLKPL